jgi:hypothetical protein
MRIYLSASYPRKHELRGYANRLIGLGQEITSSWLDEPEYGDDGVSMTVGPNYCELAARDCVDIDRSNAFVAFTEPPSGPPRGGRHVEFGYAIAKNKALFVINHRENAFHHMPNVLFFDDFEHFVRTWGHVGELEYDIGNKTYRERRGNWPMLNPWPAGAVQDE